MKYLTSKKLVTPIVVLTLISIFALFTNGVWAATQPNLPGIPGPAANAPAAGTPTGGTSLAGAATNKLTEVSTTIIAIYGILWAIQGILNGLLTFTGFVLDNVFLWAISLNPGTMPIVATGWGIIRDISNSIFILIILWIAFTIIFNFENLGGKRLLIRVIIIAILINFSLAMVSVVFGFTNALARPFRNAIVGTDSSEATGLRNVSELIVNNTKIYATLNRGTQEDLTRIRNYANEQEAERIRNIPLDIGGGPRSFQTYLGAPEEARAIPVAAVGTIAACAFGALTGIPIPGIGTTCAGLSAAVQWGITLLSLGTAIGIAAATYQSIINMAMGNIFLIITIFALLTTAVVLIARIVAMTFYAILAPAAFLLYALPGKHGQKYWDMWVDGILKWAFFAPAFYFLFYISLLILQKMNNAQPSLSSFVPNFPQILILVIFLSFLFGAIGLARKMGITVADSFVNWGKKAGWGALGLAGVGGLAKAGIKNLGAATFRRVAPEEGKVQKILRGAAEYPGLRTLSRIPARAILQKQEKLRKEVRDRAASLAPLRKEEKIAEFHRAGLVKDVVAAALALGADIKDLGDAEIKRALSNLSAFGLQADILNYRPDLATAALVPGARAGDNNHAKDLIMKKLEDKTKIVKDAIVDRNGVARDDVLHAVWMNIRNANELEKIGRENPLLQQKMQEYLNGNTAALQSAMLADPLDPTNSRAKMIQRYFTGRLAQRLGVGWGGLPPGWTPVP